MKKIPKRSTRVATLATGLVVVLLLGMILFPVSAYAASQDTSSSDAAMQEGARFNVRALLPENQFDTRLSYFDLRMEPGQVQQLEVEITNDSNEPLSVLVKAVSASTNRNGIIDYKTPDVSDRTLKNAFSDIASVDTPSVEVAPNSTGIATITLNMPQESYDGIVLGGLVFSSEQTTAPQQEKVAINNAFSYVIGAQLAVTDEVVRPDFEIVKAACEVVNYQPEFVHTIRNTEAAIAKDLNITVRVEDSQGGVHAQLAKDKIEMAPNSVLALGLAPNNGILTPGDYVSHVRIEHEGKVENFTAEFSVTQATINEAKEAVQVVEQTLVDATKIVYICMLAALFIMSVTLLLMLVGKGWRDTNKKN